MAEMYRERKRTNYLDYLDEVDQCNEASFDRAHVMNVFTVQLTANFE